MSASNPRSTNGHRRRTLRTRVLAEEDQCWLCLQPVDKRRTTPDPLSPEVHEVIPVSRGGSPIDRDNCVLTHRDCNRRAGNRLLHHGALATPAEPIRTSRRW